MLLHTECFNPYHTNCYFPTDEESGNTVVIDPGCYFRGNGPGYSTSSG